MGLQPPAAFPISQLSVTLPPLETVTSSLLWGLCSGDYAAEVLALGHKPCPEAGWLLIPKEIVPAGGRCVLTETVVLFEPHFSPTLLSSYLGPRMGEACPR